MNMATGAAEVVSIVDDDEGVREALDALLRSAGLHPVAFASAEEFLGAAERHMTRCLILDLRMPGMSGQELQERLIAEGNGIPVIIFTAHGDGEVRKRSLAAGAVAFLSKPVGGARLLEAVEMALGRRLDGPTHGRG